jgi:ubiquinone/menaquinone biosynthesis methyltransferase
MSQKPIAEVAARRGHEVDHGGAVRSMFDRIAPTYDRLNRLMSGGLDVRWRRRAIEPIASAPSGDVLDLCAGTLDFAAEIERTYPDRHVVAADFAREMLERGASKVKRVETVVADAMALPFESGRFAAIVCGFGLRNLADVDKGLDEATRVLKPGGVLIYLELFRPPSGLRGATVRFFHDAVAKTLLPAVGSLIADDREAYAYLARSMARFLTRAELETKLRARGFVDVRGEDVGLGVAAIVRGVFAGKGAA